MLRTKLLCVLFACLVSVTSATLFAQENRGNIEGLVSDQQGAAIPGATVTATNLATGVVTTTKTDAAGNYGVPFLPPGTYKVSVEAEGFSTAVNSDVVLGAAETRRVDFALQLGAVKAEADTGRSQIVRWTRSSVAGNSAVLPPTSPDSRSMLVTR